MEPWQDAASLSRSRSACSLTDVCSVPRAGEGEDVADRAGIAIDTVCRTHPDGARATRLDLTLACRERNSDAKYTRRALSSDIRQSGP